MGLHYDYRGLLEVIRFGPITGPYDRGSLLRCTRDIFGDYHWSALCRRWACCLGICSPSRGHNRVGCIARRQRRKPLLSILCWLLDDSVCPHVRILLPSVSRSCFVLARGPPDPAAFLPSSLLISSFLHFAVSLCVDLPAVSFLPEDLFSSRKIAEL